MRGTDNIQWFPGHMAKTKRMIESDLKLVDAVVEIIDARIPESSRNPILNELIKDKPRIIIMNKCDYADDNATALWKRHYLDMGIRALPCDCRSGKGVNRFLPEVKSLISELLERRKKRGMIGCALRLMVVGIPNVGKSSFINRMAKSRKTKVGDRPGVTRGKQWVSLDKDVELLDMPGILWHKFDDPDAAKKLAFTGAVKDEIMDTEALAEELGRFLRDNYGDLFRARYNIAADSENLLGEIAVSRRMTASGGVPDILRAATALLDDYRGGRIGKITLELP